MKRMSFILIVLALVVTACAAPAGNTPPAGDNTTSDENTTENSGSGNAGNADDANAVEGNADTVADPEPTLPIQPPTCYPDGTHPIAQNIADQYENTTYDQIMGWFCNGALFDDILTALTTEELTGVDAEGLLQQLATGKTWNELWLELGITEE